MFLLFLRCRTMLTRELFSLQLVRPQNRGFSSHVTQRFFLSCFRLIIFSFSPTAEAQKWVQNLLGVNVSSRLKVLVTPPFSERSRGAKSLLFLLVCTTFFFFYSLLGLIRLLLVRVNSEEGKKRKRGTLSLWCVTNFLERCKVSIEERKRRVCSTLLWKLIQLLREEEEKKTL